MRHPEPHHAADGTVTYKVRFRFNGKETSETFDTKGEADRFCAVMAATDAATALRELDHEARAATVPTVDKVAADHVDHLTGVYDETRNRYRRLWALTWGPLIGDVPANLLTRDRVAAATNELAKSYSRKSLQNQRGLLAAVCERLVDEGWLPKNPTKRMRLPRAKEVEREEMRVLTRDEFWDLLDQFDERWRPFVMFLVGMGTRWGEAVALQCKHVDTKRGTVHIRRAWKGGRNFGPPKTRKSRRTISIPPELIPILDELKAGRDPDALVFTAPRGGFIWHRTFWERVWLPAVSAAELGDPRPRIHDLRHTHASWLLDTEPIHVVQARLGHESITTTVDTYGHLMPDAQARAAKAADLAFAPRPLQIEG